MITQEETDAGLRAYEQTLAFASLRRKRLPLVYVLFPILLTVAGISSCYGGVWNLGVICILSAVLFSIFAVWNWRRLRALDVRNRELLADLRAKYGDDLPWLQVERQLAAIEAFKAELAAGQRPPEEPR
jgi:hypothetical protein